tara:strand:+ start:3670 stop:4317 length:648 start_codon:yes stop_codon:yes gene_type:complete
MSAWNILLVDSSASMSSNEVSVNKGIIDLLMDQQDNKDRFTFLTFNTDVKYVIDSKFNEINGDDIINSIVNTGLTALYDAVGHVYEMINDECVENVTFTVITDGCENSSKLHNLNSLKDLRETIDKKCNINVSFICEDQNVLNNNSAIISHANESCEVSGDYSEAFRTVSRNMSYVRRPSLVQSYSIECNNVSLSQPIVRRQQSYCEKKRPRLSF